jgi:hypothetical protein
LGGVFILFGINGSVPVTNVTCGGDFALQKVVGKKHLMARILKLLLLNISINILLSQKFKKTPLR